MTSRTYRYCPHRLLLRALAHGWAYAADLGETHGYWSCLVVWRGKGEPRWPE